MFGRALRNGRHGATTVEVKTAEGRPEAYMVKVVWYLYHQVVSRKRTQELSLRC